MYADSLHLLAGGLVWRLRTRYLTHRVLDLLKYSAVSLLALFLLAFPKLCELIKHFLSRLTQLKFKCGVVTTLTPRSKILRLWSNLIFSLIEGVNIVLILLLSIIPELFL